MRISTLTENGPVTFKMSNHKLMKYCTYYKPEVSAKVIFFYKKRKFAAKIFNGMRPPTFPATQGLSF